MGGAKVLTLRDNSQESVVSQARRIINEYDAKMTESGDFSLLSEANEKLCEMAKKETDAALNRVLMEASQRMKNRFHRAEN